jgi:hypothetical protein
MKGMHLNSEIAHLELSDLGRLWHVKMHHALRIPLAL